MIVANGSFRGKAQAMLHDHPLRYGFEIALTFSLEEMPFGTHGLRLAGLGFVLRPDDVLDGRLHSLRPANDPRLGCPERRHRPKTKPDFTDRSQPMDASAARDALPVFQEMENTGRSEFRQDGRLQGKGDRAL